MNSMEFDVIKSLVENKKYSAITEYSRIVNPNKEDIIVTEYTGSDVTVYKDDRGNVRLLCPKHMDYIQEGHVAQAISNGTIFDDAADVDSNATMIERTSLPYDAMINEGRPTPKHLKPMIAIVIGKMDHNGSCAVSDADRTNGINFIKDLCCKGAPEKKVVHVVGHWIGKSPQDFYTPEMGKSITQLDKEVDEIKNTNPENCISDDDLCQSYDEYNMDKIEKGSDKDEEDDIENKDEDNKPDDEVANKSDDEDDGFEEVDDEDESEDEDSDEDDDMDSDMDDDDSDEDNDDEDFDVEDDIPDVDDDGEDYEDDDEDESYEEQFTANPASLSPNSEDPTDSKLDASPIIPKTDQSSKVVNEDVDIKQGTEKTSTDGSVNNIPMPLSAGTKMALNNKINQECGDNDVEQEGFFTKQPKRLKPIPRDIIAYITVEMNDIHDANDQAMLSGYTCSKIELVDFYITILDTQDARYIVPHNRQYLEMMKRDLERLLAEILRIRPINRTEQIWRVNYPSSI